MARVPDWGPDGDEEQEEGQREGHQVNLAGLTRVRKNRSGVGVEGDPCGSGDLLSARLDQLNL